MTVIYKVEYIRVEKFTEKPRDLQKVSLKSSAEYLLAYTCEETTQDHRKNHPKGIEGTMLIAHRGL